MTREKRHSTLGSGNYYPNKQCGGIVRRLYERNDTGGKTRFTSTELLRCTRCRKVVHESEI